MDKLVGRITVAILFYIGFWVLLGIIGHIATALGQ